MSALVLVVTRDQALKQSLAKSLALAEEAALTAVYADWHWAWQFRSPALRAS